MKSRYCLIPIAVLLLSLAGCAGVPTQSQDAPSDEEALVEQQPVVSDNPAIIALLDRARHDAVAGQRGAAGASLERALRIEPRNAWLWHELAQLRLAQGEYAQAIAIARKSTSFAGGDRHLQALNWRVIGNARVAQGLSLEAEQAFGRAAELEHPVQK